ncbi:MAG: hypothetical protein ACREYF_07585 [Gammaproteobacteria bacterium]
MEAIDTSGKSLVGHWKWAAEKGLMNPNTANGFRAACSQVLSVEEGWETLDVRGLDVGELCRRFQIKRHKEFKTGSLEAYKRRFAQAVQLFLDYAKDPSAWKAPSQERSSRKGKGPSSEINGEATASIGERPAALAVLSGLVEYPFPLREGRLAYLKLPIDLKSAEVKRLTAYLNTLAVDGETA